MRLWAQTDRVMAREGKYPVTGRETPVGEILAVLALSALVVALATQWRISGQESWQVWLALAMFPGVLLRWLEIVRRTQWPVFEIAAAALMMLIAAWGFMRIGGSVLMLAMAGFAALTAWLAWRRLSARG